MNTKFTSSLLSVILLLAGCSDHEDWLGNGSPYNGQIEISGDINQVYETRVNDGGFVNGDAIGVYIVDYQNGQPQELLSQGNHATNIKFTFNGDNNCWTSTSKLYWTDKNTKVDAYSYYPYNERMDNVATYPFAVQHRQDKEGTDKELGGYEASDFLWAKASGAQPLNRIHLSHQHIMSSVQLTLVEGEGFGVGEWAAAEKAVTFTNTYLGAVINLQEGKAVLDESSGITSIIPYKKGDEWRCVVVPQAIDAGKDLVQISINGELYNFTRQETTVYQPGKLNKFAIKVDKRVIGDYVFTLISESISAWENYAVSHQAEARSYMNVHCPLNSNLKSEIGKLNLNADKIINLKISGYLSGNDFVFLNSLPNLTALNIQDVTLQNCTCNGKMENDAIPDAAFCKTNIRDNASKLSYIVLPTKLKKIGNWAFAYCRLSQRIDLPEGLTYIGDNAFYWQQDGSAITSVNFPTTLTYIGKQAFGYCTYLNQELCLPSNLKEIGEGAFMECPNLYGSLRIPDGVTAIQDRAFYRDINFDGSVYIPSSVTSIGANAFRYFGSDSNDGYPGERRIGALYLSEGLKTIGTEAFYRATFTGDLVVPSTVRNIGAHAFESTDFDHISLPDNFEELPSGLFMYCSELKDTFHIPSKVTHIGESAFYGCSKLEALILPENLMSLGENCFSLCHNVNYIECKSKTPPTLYGTGQFDGLAKDNFTLVVPEGCVDAYRNAPGWCEFKRISEYRNFVCRPQTARLLNKGNERKIVLNADGAWKVTHLPSWVHISKNEGVQKTELTVTIDVLSRGAGNRKDSVVFALNGTNHTSCYKIEQFDCEYGEDAHVALQTATKGKGINLVFLGDGYDAKDICDGTYLKDMQQSVEYFFDVEPYKTYRDYFNVYTAFAMSYDSGISTLNTVRNAKFDTFVGDGNTRMSCDFDKALFYAIDNTPVTENQMDGLTCIVVPNTTAYDGVTKMYSGGYGNGAAVALCPISASDYPFDARGLIQHEAGGHGFGKLADEYIYHVAWLQTCKCFCCQHVAVLQAMHSAGWGLNMSLNGKYKEVPWAHMINDNRYNDIVDIYEGGYFHSRGSFRSEQNSCMNNNVPYFSTWSRELIVRRIKALAGEQFSYEDFVAHDSREWGQDFTLLTRSTKDYNVTRSAPMHGRAPIVMNRKPIRPKK